jgi:hypothetical protein
MPNDIGRFVARYLQVLACLSIVSMVATAIFFDALHIDFSFLLLFWAAEYLIQHNPKARRWTIGVCGGFVAGAGRDPVRAAADTSGKPRIPAASLTCQSPTRFKSPASRSACQGESD